MERMRTEGAMENHKTPPEEIAYEHCVLCGGVTAIRRETSVSERADYIEGGGQLCPSCYRRLYRLTPVHA